MSSSAARAAIAIATTPAAMTADWLTNVLRSIGHEVTVANVRSEPIGTGQSAHSERFYLDYATWDGRAPASLVAKLPHPNPTSRATGHVHGSYNREVNFYRQIAPTVQVRTPRCYYSAIDADNSDFVLLLQDMAPAQQGDQMRGCSVTEAQCALREAAALHAPRWNDATLEQLAFLSGAKANATASGSLGRELVEQFWQGFCARYDAQLAPDIRELGAGLVRSIDAWSTPPPGPRCPIHGDFRLDNLLINHTANASSSTDKVTMAVVDWQTAGVGCGTSDVAYFLGAGLLPDARRQHERELLRGYHEVLCGRGVTGYDFNALWHDYRRYTFSGYFMAIIASMLVVQTDRGDEMFMTMAHRHGQHALDLDALAILEAECC